MAQLAYGVTTQRHPQTSSEDVLAYSDLMELGESIEALRADGVIRSGPTP